MSPRDTKETGDDTADRRGVTTRRQRTAKGVPAAELVTGDYAELAAFRRALREFLRFSEDAAVRAGLTARQYQALLFIRACEGARPVSIDSVAGELLIKHNSAVELVDRLVAQRYVRRRRSSQDRRRVELAVTAHGRRVLQKLASMHRAELHRIGPWLREFFARMAGLPGERG